ncbi:restriction endonuclease subunit S [Pantoea agglomerans]|uniref:restriction endonuclease subunit S n=1 Tax=Enterobacter agglomerans TaxID=549 RepID=UPI002D79203E|nr:restriction endonuclease subunit S [Pantoea agglomerans]WRO89796.1 restriction endonuclease subunit S [Pantoea agglomerans]
MAMYKAYPEYKDSGIEWLGDIPEGWTVSKVKYLAPFQVGWTPPTKNDANFIGDNLWVNISDLKDKFISSTAKFISDKAAKEASMDITPKGSLLYSFKLSVGAVSFAGCDLYTNEAIASFLSHAQLPLSYLYYALPIFIIENASTNIYGAKILNQELIKNSFLLAPPHGEAEKVANFLDHETAKIDNLIAKQQQLIELLKEKRQAVISHAVTKGLDPDVPMKDSGVEWLGGIPQHWGVTRLKYECRNIVDCPHSTPNYTDEGEYPAIRTADILAGYLDLQNCRRVTEPVYNERNFRLIPKAGDIIYSREGERFGIGAPIPEGAKVCLAQRVMLFRAKSTSGYLMWALNSSSTYTQAQQDCIGSTSPHVNVDTIKNFILAWPPESEREEISNFIHQTLDSVESLTVHLTEKLTLLQERRTALISAAVTGKIDVRDWVAPDTQSIEEPQEATA